MGLLLACFVGKSLLTLMFFALLQKDLFKGMWSLAEGFFKQNFCHACHTRFAVVFPLPSCWVSLLFLSAVTEQSGETLTASRRRGRWERREGKKKETHLPAHALPLFYILKISGKLKKITSFADFLRRSPKNVCVRGNKGYYFRRSKPGCHGLLRVLDSGSLLAEASFSAIRSLYWQGRQWERCHEKWRGKTSTGGGEVALKVLRGLL